MSDRKAAQRRRQRPKPKPSSGSSVKPRSRSSEYRLRKNGRLRNSKSANAKSASAQLVKLSKHGNRRPGSVKPGNSRKEKRQNRQKGCAKLPRRKREICKPRRKHKHETLRSSSVELPASSDALVTADERQTGRPLFKRFGHVKATCCLIAARCFQKPVAAWSQLPG